MKKLLLCSTLIPIIAFSQSLSIINKQIKSELPYARVGVMVTNAKTGKVVFSRDSNFLFTPASLMKLYPAMAALLTMGPKYRYRTELRAKNKLIKNHVLNSNLAFKFSYDPTLTALDIQSLVMALKMRGVQQINGNIYISKPKHYVAPYPPGRVWDDLGYAYGAPISNVMINQNEWRLTLLPKKKGWRARLVPSPDFGAVNLTNRTITTEKYRAGCPIRIYSYSRNSYVVAGCVPQKGVKQFRDLAYSDPAMVAQKIVQNSLRQLHIKLNGKVLIRSTSKYPQQIFYIDSAPMHKIIKYMLLHSDNLYADSIPFAILKYQKKKLRAGSSYWDSSIKNMQKVIAAKIKINPKQIKISDASGLSRYDLISPNDINKVLLYGFQDKAIRKWWLSSLPHAGANGTLKRRKKLRGFDLQAKTGSMSGVDGLAGYMRNKRGQKLAVVLIVNGFARNRAKVHKLEQNICQTIYQQS